MSEKEVTEKKQNKRGRKEKEIDWELFDKLLGYQCTLEELAGIFECSKTTIERRVVQEHEMKFCDYARMKRGVGKISLRRLQWQIAEAGSYGMAKWLGRQWLGQAEKIELTGDGGGPVRFKADFDLDEPVVAAPADEGEDDGSELDGDTGAHDQPDQG